MAPAAEEAVSWWTEASPDVFLAVVDQCTGSRPCVELKSGEVKTDTGDEGWGATRTWESSDGSLGAFITVAPDAEGDLFDVVVAMSSVTRSA